MSPTVEPRGPSTFPADPVRRLLHDRSATDAVSLAQLAAELRLPLRTLTRVLTRERLRWDTADRVAVALGRHPCQVWPDWFAGPKGDSGRQPDRAGPRLNPQGVQPAVPASSGDLAGHRPAAPNSEG